MKINWPDRKIEDMSKDERSLLLYFESQAVDYGGKLDSRRMNNEDREIAKKWNEEGFIRYGRIKANDIQRLPSHIFTHWCVFTEESWIEAHRERRARYTRLEEKLSVHRNGYDDDPS